MKEVSGFGFGFCFYNSPYLKTHPRYMATPSVNVALFLLFFTSRFISRILFAVSSSSLSTLSLTLLKCLVSLLFFWVLLLLLAGGQDHLLTQNLFRCPEWWHHTYTKRVWKGSPWDVLGKTEQAPFGISERRVKWIWFVLWLKYGDCWC